MDSRDVGTAVDNNPEVKGIQAVEHERSKNLESDSGFDPKLSSREMRKIKYYEDMFAKMANESKSTGSSGNLSNTGTTSNRNKTRVQEKRRTTESKPDRSYSSSDGYKSESIDLSNNTTTKTVRRSVYKKSTPRSSMDLNNTVTNHENNDSSSTYLPPSDGKTTLENKRLIKLQSMPTVTKKPKVVEAQHEKPSTQSRPHTKSKVSRWDVKYVSKPSNESKTDLEPVVKDGLPETEVPNKDEEKEEYYDEVPMEIEDETEMKEHLDEHEPSVTTAQTESSSDQDTKDLPLDVDDFLNEEDAEFRANEEVLEPVPEEFETVKLEEPEYSEPVYQKEPKSRTKKKSTRGRKAKTKRTTPVSSLVQEQTSDPDKQALEEDFTPTSPQAESLEESRPPARTRTKSQRNKKKKQEFYEPERPFSRSKHSSKSKSSRGQATTSEKHERSYGSTKGEMTEDKFISIENLRMITMEEAEKMINVCKGSDTDLENLRNMIQKTLRTNAYEEYQKKDSQKMNMFLLDPSNIVAPTMVYNQLEVEHDVPDDPIKLSFKYKLFENLNKV